MKKYQVRFQFTILANDIEDARKLVKVYLTEDTINFQIKELEKK